MLVRCPRCNFSQPKDQYCAQCGIDMTTFKTEGPSFFARLLASKTFIVFIIFALTLAAGTYISKNATSQRLVEKLTNYDLSSNRNIEITPVGSETSNITGIEDSTSDKPSQTTDKSESASSEETAQLPNSMASETEISPPTVDSRQTDPGVTSNNTTTNTIRSRMVRVYYTSVSREQLAKIFSEAQSTNQFANFGAYSAGVIQELGQKLTPSNTQIKILHQVEKRIEERRNATWFVGRSSSEDPNSNLGFSTSFDLREYDQQNVRGAILVTRYWKEINRFPAEIEMNYQNGFFISGIMPNHLPIGTNEAVLNTPPLQILRDTDFRARKSEFVIFVEIDNN